MQLHTAQQVQETGNLLSVELQISPFFVFILSGLGLGVRVNLVGYSGSAAKWLDTDRYREGVTLTLTLINPTLTLTPRNCTVSSAYLNRIWFL